MKWDDFAVQIEDPQLDVFQLGYVNLASAEIKGFEAEFAVTFNQHWQLDGSSRLQQCGDLRGILVLGQRMTTDDTFSFDVPKGSRLPLSPDWSGALGIEFRPGGLLFNAQPYRALRLFVRRRLGQFARGHRVGGVRTIPSTRRRPTRSAICASGWRAITGAARSSSTMSGMSARTCSCSNRWGVQRQAVNPPRTLGIQFATRSDRALTILVATSVVRGSRQGESHGGVYLVDFDADRAVQVLDWNTMDIDWQGRGWDRGLRGIAFDGEVRLHRSER